MRRISGLLFSLNSGMFNTGLTCRSWRKACWLSFGDLCSSWGGFTGSWGRVSLTWKPSSRSYRLSHSYPMALRHCRRHRHLSRAPLPLVRYTPQTTDRDSGLPEPYQGNRRFEEEGNLASCSRNKCLAGSQTMSFTVGGFSYMRFLTSIKQRCTIALLQLYYLPPNSVTIRWGIEAKDTRKFIVLHHSHWSRICSFFCSPSCRWYQRLFADFMFQGRSLILSFNAVDEAAYIIQLAMTIKSTHCISQVSTIRRTWSLGTVRRRMSVVQMGHLMLREPPAVLQPALQEGVSFCSLKMWSLGMTKSGLFLKGSISQSSVVRCGNRVQGLGFPFTTCSIQ